MTFEVSEQLYIARCYEPPLESLPWCDNAEGSTGP
jgi:hypothetical protein